MAVSVSALGIAERQADGRQISFGREKLRWSGRATGRQRTSQQSRLCSVFLIELEVQRDTLKSRANDKVVAE